MADNNKVRFGFKKVHYALLQEDESGNITYGDPVAWKGARALQLNAEGESSTYFADDGPWFVTDKNNGFTGDLTMAYMSDKVLKDIYGWFETEGGMLVEDANALPKEIALLCEFDGDKKATRHVWYRVVLGRPPVNAETKESQIDPAKAEVSVSVTAVPIESGDRACVQGKARLGDSEYETFFDTAPVLPTAKQG